MPRAGRRFDCKLLSPLKTKAKVGQKSVVSCFNNPNVKRERAKTFQGVRSRDPFAKQAQSAERCDGAKVSASPEFENCALPRCSRHASVTSKKFGYGRSPI